MTPMQTEIALTFRFDAAHHFPKAGPDHRYGRMHGHSFEAAVHVRGIPDPTMGFIVDFDALRAACARLHDALDHQLLNEVPGLETPSLENIASWLWRQLIGEFPGLVRIEVARPSMGERCFYSG